MIKPRVFIASSSEGLDIAYAIQELLDRSAECTVWDQDVFEPTSNTLDEIVKASKESDYGIFVFSADDIVNLRNEKYKVTRDNVILELGLFIGALGKECCFIIVPHKTKDFHIPTDLTGLKTLEFNNNRDDGNLKAALGPCVNQVKKSIQKHGLQKEQKEKKPAYLGDMLKTVGLSAFYSSRDDYTKYRTDAASIDKYINNAKKTLKMVGISLITGIQFDDVLRVLKSRLESQADFQVTISLLNPYKNEPYIVLAPCFDTDGDTLMGKTKESLKALYELKTCLSEEAKKRFTLKAHNVVPFGSVIMLDDDTIGGKIQIEVKPYKVGLRKSFAYELVNEGGLFFETIRTSYINLINDGLQYEEILHTYAGEV
jgi:hypothetical protein